MRSTRQETDNKLPSWQWNEADKIGWFHLEPNLSRKLLDDRGFTYTRRPPDENRSYRSDVQEQLGQGFWRNCIGCIHLS
jgi:hypothetical protein